MQNNMIVLYDSSEGCREVKGDGFKFHYKSFRRFKSYFQHQFKEVLKMKHNRLNNLFNKLLWSRFDKLDEDIISLIIFLIYGDNDEM